jgi:hypothetical protein
MKVYKWVINSKLESISFDERKDVPTTVNGGSKARMRDRLSLAPTASWLNGRCFETRCKAKFTGTRTFEA